MTGLNTLRSKAKHSAAVLTALLVTMLMVFAPQTVYAANADDGEGASGGTKAYELLGEWKEQPEEVTSGLDVLSMVWHMDINDSAAAPGNKPTDDNLLTVTVENARFGEIPSECRTGDAGASTLSEDRRTLACDIGPRDEGTAQMVLSGVEVDGPAESSVSAKASFRGLEAELPKIPIRAPFLMDAKFDGGAPTSLTGKPDTYQFISFPFSLAHSTGSAAGPDSVSYDITINGVRGERITTQDTACAPIDRVQSGYPYSADGFPQEQTTNFPTCDFTLVDPETNTFRLTLSDLDYESERAQLDSNGIRLPQVQPKHPREVIAAGELRVKVPYVVGGGKDNRNTNISLKASAPTYTAADGSTSDDDPSNNSNRAPMIRGNWTGAWVVGSQSPKSYPGIGWSDTSRAPVGASVMSVSGIAPPRTESTPDTWICNTIDTERVDFQDARVVADPDAKPNVYYGENVDDIKILYYTGEVEDPNLFECGTKETRHDEGKDEKDGWSYTKPDDPSKVKAVKVRIPRDKGHLSKLPGSYFYLTIEQKIHDDVPIGADVWTWTSVLNEGQTEWTMNLQAKEWLDRITDELPITARLASPGVVVDGARYPYAGPGRDLLRTVASLPVVTKDVAQPEYGPGEEADYSIRYGLESEIANMPHDDVVLEDTLAPGMEYVPGSASPEPAVSTNSKGRQVLKWTMKDIEPNVRVFDNDPYVMNYKATLPKDAKAGDVFTNDVTASSQGVTRKAQAKVTVPKTGYTTIKKSVDKPIVESLDNGVAPHEWTIELGSKDPTKSNLTDVIDVLPSDGDAQGSEFSGDLKVTGVEGAEGATVYSTTADPADIDEDPNAKANGGTGTPSDMWTEGIQDDATAVRVITKAPLAYDDVQKITVKTELHGAESGDVVVNKAVGRADHTKLRMRTSAQSTVLTPVDVNVEKVWKDEDGKELAHTPKSVKVQLLRTQGFNSETVGDKVELSADNDWKHTFTDLPTVVDGKEVRYSVVEDEVDGFFPMIFSDKNGSAYDVTVTNMREPEHPPVTGPSPTPEPSEEPTEEPTPDPTPNPSEDPTEEPRPEPSETPGTSETPDPESSESPKSESSEPPLPPAPGAEEPPAGHTPTQPETSEPAPSESDSPLPRTGAEITALLLLAGGAIALGSWLVHRARRQ